MLKAPLAVTYSGREGALAAVGNDRSIRLKLHTTALGFAFSQLFGSLHRSLDRVQERSAGPGALELANPADRRPARRGDHLPQRDRVHLLVAEQLRRPEHR